MSWVGIDLGTTHTRVSVFHNDTVNIITNGADMRMTPSCVTFSKEQRFFGEVSTFFFGDYIPFFCSYDIRNIRS